MKTLTASKNNKFHKNRNCGFSLVTMLSISLIATLVVSGLLAGILPIYRSVSGEGSRFQLKNFAEASVDYVLAELNDPDFAAKVAADDDIGSASIVVGVTASELGLPGPYSAQVTISNEMPTPDSRLFNLSLSPYSYIQQSNGSFTPVQQEWSYFANGKTQKNVAWRTITSVVSFGSLIETVAVAAKIDYSVSKGSSSQSAKPFFNYAALGSQTINLKNESSTFGYGIKNGAETPVVDSTGLHALGGDIAAYYQATFDGSSNKIGGSLDVPSIEAPSDVSAATAGPTTVNRYLTVNETAPSFSTSDVLAASTPSSGDYPPQTRDAIQINQQNQQTQLPPAPNAPASSAVTSDGTLNISSSTTLTGDYYVSSMNMPSGTITAKGASIYIQDNGTSDQVMNLSGSVNPTAGASPAEFQIWYNGHGKLQLKAANMRATIYAPNAEVEISSPSSAKGSFKGAVVARDLTVSNVDLGFDKTLSTSPSLKYDPSQLTNLSSYKVAGYKEALVQK